MTHIPAAPFDAVRTFGRYIAAPAPEPPPPRPLDPRAPHRPPVRLAWVVGAVLVLLVVWGMVP